MSISNPVNNLTVAKRIADPVHGLIRLTDVEAKLLQHPAFQRLRGITQLGMVKYVYPGAMHNRFSHSLGVIHNVTQIFDVAYRNYMRSPQLSGDIKGDQLFSDFMLQATRLAAMCHDLGHFPFSHNLEQALDWMESSSIIPKTFRHEQLSAKIVREVVSSILKDYTDIVAGLITSDYSVLDQCLFPAYVISSAIDADRMDYLARDGLNCGVEQGNYDKERLLDSILPYSTTVNNKKQDVLAFRSKGIEAIEQFLLARHRMHQTVYFNPSVVAFEAGLRRAYYMISTDDPPWVLPGEFLDDPQKLLEFEEGKFFTQLNRELKYRNSWLVDPLLKRTPLRKLGPYYHTIIDTEQTSDDEQERFELLSKYQEKLETPEKDWHKSDHWVYVENKVQTLVDSIPLSIIDTNRGFETPQSIKNMVLLINAKGDLIDPTNVSFGHTFLPFITGHTYHRFLFFTHKKNTKRIYKELKPVIDRFEDFQTRQFHSPVD